MVRLLTRLPTSVRWISRTCSALVWLKNTRVAVEPPIWSGVSADRVGRGDPEDIGDLVVNGARHIADELLVVEREQQHIVRRQAVVAFGPLERECVVVQPVVERRRPPSARRRRTESTGPRRRPFRHARTVATSPCNAPPVAPSDISSCPLTWADVSETVERTLTVTGGGYNRVRVGAGAASAGRGGGAVIEAPRPSPGDVGRDA